MRDRHCDLLHIRPVTRIPAPALGPQFPKMIRNGIYCRTLWGVVLGDGYDHLCSVTPFTEWRVAGYQLLKRFSFRNAACNDQLTRDVMAKAYTSASRVTVG
jgi:hypothetical protein